MVVISLTSVPPRFATLPRVLRALLAQGAGRVILTVPRQYWRFPGDVHLPTLPDGVDLLRPEQDLGPATKVIPAARALRGQGATLVYCDDDWIYGPGWLDALLNVPGDVAAGAAFPVARLKRAGHGKDVVQGFAGVRIRPELLPESAFDIPPEAFAVDDIWLSGHYAAQGAAVTVCPAARAAAHPLGGPGLQDERIGGLNRAEANAACARIVHDRLGVWPPL